MCKPFTINSSHHIISRNPISHVRIVLFGVLFLGTLTLAEDKKLHSMSEKKIEMTISVVSGSNPTELLFKITNHSEKTYQLFDFHDVSGRNEALLKSPSGQQLPFPIRKDFLPPMEN